MLPQLDKKPAEYDSEWMIPFMLCSSSCAAGMMSLPDMILIEWYHLCCEAQMVWQLWCLCQRCNLLLRTVNLLWSASQSSNLLSHCCWWLKQITQNELYLSSIKVETLICSVGPSVLSGFYFSETVSNLNLLPCVTQILYYFAVFLRLTLNIMWGMLASTVEGWKLHSSQQFTSIACFSFP